MYVISLHIFLHVCHIVSTVKGSNVVHVVFEHSVFQGERREGGRGSSIHLAEILLGRLILLTLVS